MSSSCAHFRLVPLGVPDAVAETLRRGMAPDRLKPDMEKTLVDALQAGLVEAARCPLCGEVTYRLTDLGREVAS